jgi:hypothetical protein
MTSHSCTWDDSDATRIVHNKKAIGACLFISFLGYTAAVLIGELKRGTKVSYFNSKKSLDFSKYASLRE